MVTVIVKFKLPEAITKLQAQEIFLSTAPKYRDMPGLIRKYYFLDEDGITAGGIYLLIDSAVWGDKLKIKFRTKLSSILDD